MMKWGNLKMSEVNNEESEENEKVIMTNILTNGEDTWATQATTQMQKYD